jgi:hypothetical protein
MDDKYGQDGHHERDHVHGHDAGQANRPQQCRGEGRGQDVGRRPGKVEHTRRTAVLLLGDH